MVLKTFLWNDLQSQNYIQETVENLFYKKNNTSVRLNKGAKKLW